MNWFLEEEIKCIDDSDDSKELAKVQEKFEPHRKLDIKKQGKRDRRVTFQKSKNIKSTYEMRDTDMFDKNRFKVKTRSKSPKGHEGESKAQIINFDNESDKQVPRYLIDDESEAPLSHNVFDDVSEEDSEEGAEGEQDERWNLIQGSP